MEYIFSFRYTLHQYWVLLKPNYIADYRKMFVRKTSTEVAPVGLLIQSTDQELHIYFQLITISVNDHLFFFYFS